MIRHNTPAEGKERASRLWTGAPHNRARATPDMGQKTETGNEDLGKENTEQISFKDASVLDPALCFMRLCEGKIEDTCSKSAIRTMKHQVQSVGVGLLRFKAATARRSSKKMIWRKTDLKWNNSWGHHEIAISLFLFFFRRQGNKKKKAKWSEPQCREATRLEQGSSSPLTKSTSHGQLFILFTARGLTGTEWCIPNQLLPVIQLQEKLHLLLLKI